MLMKPFNQIELTELFWEGHTETNEDRILEKISCEEGLNKTDDAYFLYLQEMRQTPENLEKDIWNRIHPQKKLVKQVVFRWAVAASLLLLVGVGGVFHYQKVQSERRSQFALLESALNLISSEIAPAPQPDVLYSDDYIVILSEN
jgi:hypothetical protein